MLIAKRSSKLDASDSSAAVELPTDESGLGVWVTRGAFVLALGIVLTRATMLEILRDPLAVAPGSLPSPDTPGAGTSLVFDLLAWVPALLVLARAAFDRAYVVRFTWAHAILTALAIWMVLSTAWASDKFAAVVSGFHFLSAAVFLWSATQFVCSWRRLRIVAGTCVALLLLYGAQALSYRYTELPEMRKDWLANREQHLREHGLEAGSFAAETFEAKLLRGEMMGFHASPNSFAAVTVMLIVVSAGVIVQRIVNRDGVGWVVVPVAGILVGGAIIVWTDSKTAYATPVLAAGMFGLLALRGLWLARHAKLAYFAGVICFVLGAAAMIGHGLRHGSLIIDSLTFRWRYWVGAAHIVASHPILGVGWENFGIHYLAARLPIAAEEVRDPHNFIVRFFAELGVVGGVGIIAFMLRLWWELTRPRVAGMGLSAGREEAPARSLPRIGAILAASVMLSILATVDFGFMSTGGTAGPAYVLLRLLERGAGAIIALTGLFAATTGTLAESEIDDRPSPWVMNGVLVGLGVFLLHNLVDFSMFEAGPMFLFALLAGAAIGMREVNRDTQTKVKPENGRGLFVMTAVAFLAWLVVAGALAAPVVIAEGDARAGDEYVRTSSFTRAAQAYKAAAATVPYNAEYSFRAAQVLQSGIDASPARDAFDAAIRANPLSAGYYSARGAYEARQAQPDAGRVQADYDRSLALDPENVETRLEYAKTLEALHLPAEARQQYEKALWFNDQLAPDEIERLAPPRVADINAAIARLPR